ncbi:MAG: sulfatase-like hydrolase/transferase [Planctomycetes bacterium]|nr:sulfatase-like hydrolase/transferase [Planctomycetota bacterium]
MKNVILITIDALRAGHLSYMGYNRDTSPFMDKLAQEGTIFLQAFSNSCWTAASFPSILSSDYPVLGNRYGIKDRLAIQEILSSNGYQTATLHSNPWLFGHMGYSKGFDYFEDYSSQHYTDRVHPVDDWSPNKTENRKKARSTINKLIMTHNTIYSAFSAVVRTKKLLFPDKYIVPYCEGLILTRDAISWLKEQRKEPFFLWLHYMDPHGPHVWPPTQYKIAGPKVNKEELKQRLHGVPKHDKTCVNHVADLINKYDSRIRHTDYAVERLITYLQESGILDNSLIIITADHGEEFFDHGGIGHAPNLYDELIHVPLIISAPDIPKGVQSDRIVQHMDIAPTILDMLGLPVPKLFQGENLFNETSRQGIICEVSNEINKAKIDLGKLKVAYRTRGWKYIHTVEGKDELYNLAEDPTERSNLIHDKSAKAEEYMGKIQTHLDRKKTIYQDFAKRERDKAKLRKLKSKGKF